MGRTVVVIALLMGCHAHQTQGKQQSLATPPATRQVSSERPVRTTPGGMLDQKAIGKIQAALAHHGVKVASSGVLDQPTQAALRRFQKRQGIARTGLPDYDTLRRLGLDPKTIYLGGTARASGKPR